ncbi:unnamed protein product [Lactuca virosa]|uniref:Purple acid phosphatase n=1 Tax=Lactuca virosa TaxID=75947 RepID=A0AAU9NWI2_9ASTR|nr:unnamed protein product [Lactuca virosa]
MSFPEFRLLAMVAVVFAGAMEISHAYERPPPREDLFVSLAEDADSTTPQQIHVSLVGEDRMRISWITDEHTPAMVNYGTSPGKYKSSAKGTISSYKYINYTSGEIHDVVIGPLDPNTMYYYSFAPVSTPEYSFKTPPAQFPIKFAISGDLGQTEWTKTTLEHISQANYDVFLLPGDLCYAEMVQPIWDSFGRLVEPLASKRPWMVTQGNHEMEIIPATHPTPFTSYNARWHMPFEESGSTSNLYYSFEVSGVHVIMFGFLHRFWTWVEPISMSVDMKESMEGLLYEARVDVVFAGHVHAYERFIRVYNQNSDDCAPVHITIGDGGNRGRSAGKYKEPQPTISVFREVSFGHGRLEIVNSSYAKWSWHRNDDDISVQSDSIWLKNLASDQACNKLEI